MPGAWSSLMIRITFGGAGSTARAAESPNAKPAAIAIIAATAASSIDFRIPAKVRGTVATWVSGRRGDPPRPSWGRPASR